MDNLEDLTKKQSDTGKKVSYKDVCDLLADNKIDKGEDSRAFSAFKVSDILSKEDKDKQKKQIGSRDTFNSLMHYMKEIGKYNLLSREEERKMLEEKYAEFITYSSVIFTSESLVDSIISKVNFYGYEKKIGSMFYSCYDCNDISARRRLDADLKTLKELAKRKENIEKNIYKLERFVEEIRPREEFMKHFREEFLKNCVDEKLRDRLNSAYDRYVSIKRDFAKRNLRLVISIAKKYRNKGIPFMDLIQSGNVGLMKAIEKMDIVKYRSRFSTYGSWWIMQTISRDLTNANYNNSVRVPVNVLNDRNRIKNCRQEYFAGHGQYPDEDSLSDMVGIKKEKIMDSGIQNVISLDKIEDEYPVFGAIKDPRIPSSLKKTQVSHLKDIIDLAFGVLDSREKEVIEKRYGLRDGSTYTLQEIGDMFDLTRERIRQIEKKAIKKFQHYAKSKSFPDIHGAFRQHEDDSYKKIRTQDTF